MSSQENPGLSDDVAAALAGAGLTAAVADTALIVARCGVRGAGTSSHSSWRVVWANPIAVKLLGTADLGELTQSCLSGAEAGARQLARLADRLSPDAAPVGLRLRLRLGAKLQMISLTCRRLPGPWFIVAPWGGGAFRQTLQATAPDQHVPAAAPVAILEHDAAPLVDRRGNVRFLWRTDREGRLTRITGALCEAVGCNPEQLLNQDFQTVLAARVHDRDGKLHDALGRQDTWSGVEVLWPISGAAQSAPVVFGALPCFDRERAFDGFSGFGVIHLDRLVPTPKVDVARDDEQSASDDDNKAAMTAAEDEYDALDHDAPPENAPAITTLTADMAEASEAAEEGRAGPDDAPQTSGQEPLDDTLPAVNEDEPELPFGANVVPIRAWQRDHRAPLAVSELPSFVKTGDAPRSEPAAAPADAERSHADRINAQAEDTTRETLASLSPAERNAFREIARALSARNAEPSTRADSKPHETPARQEAPPEAPAPKLPQAGAAKTEASAAEIAAPAPMPDTRGQKDIMRADVLALVERLDAGILVSKGGVPAFVNKTLLDMLGYDDIDAFYNAGGVDRMFRGRDPDALSRDADGGAIPVIASNGDVLALEGRVQRIEWDGEPASLMTFRRSNTQELTAKLRALELDVRQREAEARETHAILDTATDGVVLVDTDGRILSLNKSGQALFGYDQNEVAGEPFTVLLAPESQAPALDYLHGLKSNGVKSLLNDGREITGRARQGGTIPLFMTIGQVGVSQPQRFCAVLRDLTQWKKVERELSEARKEAERTSALKSDFLAKVSHEIRTPLNAILGFAEVIMDERFGPVGNQRYKDYLKDIHSSGAHVLSLVNDLLDLSKIEAGKMDLNFGAVNANKIVNECVSLLQTQATRERVVVRVSLAPRLPSVVADERSLRQIVLNILSNAVKFNEPGGQVIVSTALTDAGQAVIRIRDTGIGMNEKELELALEPFRQVATSRPTNGTGLGLPLTKALVEANRAAFTIRSRKGEGTMVEVTFPQTRVLAE